MNKPKLNYIIDILLFLFFLATAVSGLVLKFFLPSGIRQGRLQEFLGIQKHGWSEFHDWTGIVFIVLVAVHFALHWDWIVCMTKSFFKREPVENK